MPVNFDSSGHGAKLSLSNTGTLTWTHTVSTLATNTVVLVGILWNGDVDAHSASFSASYGSTAMTLLYGPSTWAGGIGSTITSSMSLFGLTSPPSGTSTITVGYSGMSGSLITDQIMGVSASYSGVASIDAAAVASNSTTANNSITVSSTAAANRVITLHGVNTLNSLRNYTGSLRASSAPLLGGQLIIGDTAGASSVTATATQISTAKWSAIGVNLEPAVVTASAIAPPIALGPTLAKGGVFRHSLPPVSRTWLIGVGGLYGPVDTRIGPTGPSGNPICDAYINSSGQLVFQVQNSNGVPQDIPTAITIPAAINNGDGTATVY